MIDVFVDGVKHSIERRYSEFEDLHKTVSTFSSTCVQHEFHFMVQELR